MIGRFFLPSALAAVAVIAATLPSSDARAGDFDMNWTGPHVGIFGAMAWGRLDTEGNRAHISNDNDEVPIVGAQAGYRFDLGRRLLLNALVEVPLISTEDGADDTRFFPAPAFNPPVTYEYDVNYAIFLTAQIGRSYGRFLPFFEFGAGLVDVTYRVRNVIGGGTYSPGALQETSNLHRVWKIGLGLDYALSKRIVAGIKANFMQSTEKSYDLPWNAPPPNRMGATAILVGAHLSLKL